LSKTELIINQCRPGIPPAGVQAVGGMGCRCTQRFRVRTYSHFTVWRTTKCWVLYACRLFDGVYPADWLTAESLLLFILRLRSGWQKQGPAWQRQGSGWQELVSQWNQLMC